MNLSKIIVMNSTANITFNFPRLYTDILAISLIVYLINIVLFDDCLNLIKNNMPLISKVFLTTIIVTTTINLITNIFYIKQIKLYSLPSYFTNVFISLVLFILAYFIIDIKDTLLIDVFTNNLSFYISDNISMHDKIFKLYYLFNMHWLLFIISFITMFIIMLFTTLRTIPNNIDNPTHLTAKTDIVSNIQFNINIVVWFILVYLYGVNYLQV